MTNKVLQPATLKVLSQSCLQQQMQNVNGSIKDVHVVVKNHPFYIQVALSGGDSTVNFHRLSLEATLLYDSPSLDKTVDFIKVKPLEFHGRLDDGSQGLRYTLELSIKVLSSQHEDSLFKVRLQAINQHSRQPVPGLVAYSSEILVISKPEVLRKKTEPKGQRKRTRDDQIVEALARIEKRLDVMAAAGHAAEKEVGGTGKGDERKTVVVEAPQKQPFEGAVVNFISSFSSLTQDERPEKVRRVIRSLPRRDIEKLSEVIDLFYAEGLQRHLLKNSHAAAVGARPSSLHHPLPLSVETGEEEIEEESGVVAPLPPPIMKYEELPSLGIDSHFEFDLPSTGLLDSQRSGVDLCDFSDLLLHPEHLAAEL